MAVTVMRDASASITCPQCGRDRVVSPSWGRRSAKSGGTLCDRCRGGAGVRRHKDSDLRFWLRAFGAEIPPEVPVRQFITAGGAPPELVQLAKEVYPDAALKD